MLKPWPDRIRLLYASGATDINSGAAQTTTKRPNKVAAEIRQQLPHEDQNFFTGFDVLNVKHYDIFRNRTQAKERPIESLEVQELEMSA